MKATEITYKRVVSDLQYGNRQLEVTIELDEGDNADEAFTMARDFVQRSLGLTEQGRLYDDSDLPWATQDALEEEEEEAF